MPDERKPLRDPFDLALMEFYREDCDHAVYKRLVEIAVELGEPMAMYAMATWYLHGARELGVRKNHAKAAALLERCAPFMHHAAYDLAVSKRRGAGTKRDPIASYHLLVRAGQLGSLPALHAQAWALDEGHGVPRDRETARLLRRKVKDWVRQIREAEALRKKPPAARKKPPAAKRGARAR